MANCAVLASGAGTNFEAIARLLGKTSHKVVALLCDRKRAFVLRRAQELQIPAYYIPYDKKKRSLFESTAITILQGIKVDLIVLAGFMRILSSQFVDTFPGRIINIHPSLLPAYPGTRAIERSFASGDSEVGVTVHYVDHGLDSGPIIARRSFKRNYDDNIEHVEASLHAIEHDLYPQVVLTLLDDIDKEQFSRTIIGESQLLFPEREGGES